VSAGPLARWPAAVADGGGGPIAASINVEGGAGRSEFLQTLFLDRADPRPSSSRARTYSASDVAVFQGDADRARLRRQAQSAGLIETGWSVEGQFSSKYTR